MRLILLSGGSGKRLWPLSNGSRSKQFLKLLPHKENELVSMVQRLWGQLELNQLSDNSYISTCQTQVDVIQNQLGTNIPLIIEPEPRDTFAAISLATMYLSSIDGIPPEELIIVMPVDPYVEDQFFENIRDFEKVFNQLDTEIALIGVTPTYPSTKYGYILPDYEKTQESFMKVKSFKEKPSEEQAQKLIDQNAFWNAGVFSFRLGYMIDQLEKRNLPTDYQKLVNQYNSLPKISFDYEILEKSSNITMVPYNGYWKDLGTWNTLTEDMQTNLIGNGYISDNCTNTHVVNELGLPIIVLDTSNLVVAASPDGILVSNKSSSHHIKEISKVFYERPMYEERRWGWYRVLDYNKSIGGKELLTKHLYIFADKNISYQYHHKRSEIWVIVAGEGEFVLDGEFSSVKTGDVLVIPVGGRHGIRAIKDLEIIEVQMGSKLEEEDIVRLAMSWEDLKGTL